MGLARHLWLPALTCAIASCGSGSGDGSQARSGQPTEQLFVDATVALGLGGASTALPDGTYSLPEITGPGVGLFDADRDGRLDIVVPQAPPPGHPSAPATNRYLHQRADGTFEDLSAASGLADPGFGQGVVIGDVNGDGAPDVVFLNLGPDALYVNRGDGTFERGGAGLGDAWSISGALADVDDDGDLDLFVVHYVRFDPKTACRSDQSVPEFCGPDAYDRTRDTLYLNDGAGGFSEAPGGAGLNLAGAGLGALALDFTGDGHVDLYVANDGHANFLWVNRGDGTFDEQATMRGASVNRYGKAEASMGLAVGDVDLDQDLDLFMTHLRGENNTLYVRGARDLYADATVRAGMSGIDLSTTGFGCGFLDVDHDGDLDLAVVNGRVARGPVHPDAELSDFWNDYAEPNLFFRNDGTGRFVDDSPSASALTGRVDVARGLATGDVDGDGAVDLVVTDVSGALRVLRNAGASGHWLAVRAVEHGRDAPAAQVVVTSGDFVRRGIVAPTQGYASSSEPRAHFGLGDRTTCDGVEVRWPDGTRERFPGGAVDRELVLVRGSGEAP